MNLFEMLEQNGINTETNQKSVILSDIGLDWEVKKEKLILPDGTDSGFYGVVRQDTRHTFGTCKDSYETFQNAELLDLINTAANNLGLRVDKGGSFKNGALPYLQIETGRLTGIGENNDQIEKYVTAINSHDGSCSLKWGLYNRTISCSNQLWSLKQNLQNSVKHTTNMRFKIQEIMESIEKSQEAEKTLYEIYFKFAQEPMQRSHTEMLVKTALDIDLNEKQDELSQYQKNRLYDLSGAIQRETNEKGSTLWGLFSGLTYYTTHLLPGGDVNRQQSKAIGKGAKVDNEVFNQFAELVA